jgi:tRNA-specific 2-thiouridylase
MPARRPKVLLAMSGGVDSSVAAALLLEQGYDVVGCFMRLGSPGEELDTLRPDSAAPAAPPTCDPAKLKIGHQGCCSINDAADARLVAAQLGIPFYVVNFKKDFGRIIDYFVADYVSGRTPNPCVRCNDWLKFGKLHDYARQIDADFVASGHYARVELAPDGSPILQRGIDLDKDQSYVLFGVPRERLAHMLLPIGRLRKAQVREHAHALGLPVFDKPDSQEICFVPDNDYAGLVDRHTPAAAREGPILDESGRVLGTHRGQYRFTIGQRRGIGIALGHPIYVIDKDPAANSVTVGPPERLLASGCTVAEANWLRADPAPPASSNTPDADGFTPALAQFRSNSDPTPARFRLLPDDSPADAARTPSGRAGRFEVRFDQPQTAVSPGQALVLFGGPDHQTLLGGGWIRSAHRAAE